MSLTLGSLFDGIGGFPLAAQTAGITPIWASEIEPAAVAITKRHFPDMKHLGDVTENKLAIFSAGLGGFYKKWSNIVTGKILQVKFSLKTLSMFCQTCSTALTVTVSVPLVRVRKTRYVPKGSE